MNSPIGGSDYTYPSRGARFLEIARAGNPGRIRLADWSLGSCAIVRATSIRSGSAITPPPSAKLGFPFVALTLFGIVLMPSGLLAQEPVAVVVTATRVASSGFETPAAVSVVNADEIGMSGPRVNLSEALARAPGITALNRSNYAQDLQVSIRGFGSRSTFGIRGVRLIVDGILATMPDGQGQASTVSLPSAARIEVLRGPLAQLYGNAAGGVVQVFTLIGGSPEAVADFVSGSDAQYRLGARVVADGKNQRAMADFSRFRSDGYRDHSAARREQLNAKWRWQWSDATRIDTVANVFDQPEALDPGGLTRAQWEADPRQAAPAAIVQNARKRVRQGQLGSVIEHRADSSTMAAARLYAGERDLENALSIAPAAQLPPTSSGGIVAFERIYGGGAIQLDKRFALGEERSLRVVVGIEHDRMDEDRQGYLNLAGQRGELRRDEDNRVASTDAFLQASIDLSKRWSAILGARSSEVSFTTRDRYTTAANPDDSGELKYRAVNPVVGIMWRASEVLNLYANAGRGFETPTFTELAYRANASGFNTALNASRSRHSEVGAKWRPSEGHALDLAIFGIRTRDEIVVDTNVGGRSTFKNAGRTQRNGGELHAKGPVGRDVRYLVSAVRLDTDFDGKRLPGTPDRSLFAELVYAPRTAWAGFQAAIEVVHTGRLYVNDANDDFAPAASRVNFRAGLAQKHGPWEFEQRLRLENATGRRYAGSVIVNDSQRRYFEPAPPRNWMVALTIRHRW